MAGAEIIASGIGILCLIIFGYVLVGGILSVGENAASAQTDYILMKESQRETAIKIPDSSPSPEFIDCHLDGSVQKCNLTFNITNTGTEILGDFNYMDVFVNTSEDNTLKYHKFDQTTIGSGGDETNGNWSYIQISPDIIHPHMLDPNEKMKVQINNYSFSIIPSHYTIKVVTPNGVTDTYTK